MSEYNDKSPSLSPKDKSDITTLVLFLNHSLKAKYIQIIILED